MSIPEFSPYPKKPLPKKLSSATLNSKTEEETAFDSNRMISFGNMPSYRLVYSMSHIS